MKLINASLSLYVRHDKQATRFLTQQLWIFRLKSRTRGPRCHEQPFWAPQISALSHIRNGTIDGRRN
jgi:hypothetical protein